MPFRRALPLIALVAASLTVLATPAAAAPLAGPPADPREAATAAAPPPASATPHCIVRVSRATASTPRCYSSFRAAIAAATAGAVTDAPASPAAAAADPAFTAEVESGAVTAASALVGIEYADRDYRGSSLVLYAAGGCDNSSDVDYRFASLASGWNDRISSFRSYNNCAQQLYRSTSFGGGALTSIISSMAYVGAAANDQASSITFN